MTQDQLFTDQELEEMGMQTVEQVEQAIDKGEYEEARRLARRMYREFSSMHDLYVEWITATLTFIYQRYGDQALYDALHKGVGAWTAPLVELYKGKEAKHRARLLISALRGHLQPVKVLEDNEKFTMMMQPCGSGARLVQRDKHSPTTHHAKVKKPQPMTFNRRDFPIYCTHCYFTNIIPREIGWVPPFLAIPAETIGEQPCRFLVYKDPGINPKMHTADVKEKSKKQ